MTEILTTVVNLAQIHPEAFGDTIGTEDVETEVKFLRTGTFWDKNGRRVEITDQRLEKIVQAFHAGEAEQEVPVDIMHERGEAAGWIRDVFKKGKWLIARVLWNPLGQKLIKEKRYRYVSATLAKDILKTISLVNLPAVKGQEPLSLSEGDEASDILFADDVDASFGHKAGRVRRAYFEQVEESTPDIAPESVALPAFVHVYQDFVIVEKDEKAWKIPYTETDEGIMFAWDKSRRVKLTWSELGEQIINQPPLPPWEKKTMPEEPQKTSNVTDDLQEPNGSQEVASTAPDTGAETNQTGNQMTTDEFVAQLAQLQTGQLETVFNQFMAQAEGVMQTKLNEYMTEFRERQQLLQFCERATTTGRNALPFKPNELFDMLSEIPHPHRETVLNILSTVTDSGLIDLSELGTSVSDTSPRKKELPDVYKELLQEWMDAGGTVATFFEENPEIGAAGEYDLAGIS